MKITNCFSIVKIYDKNEKMCHNCNSRKCRYYIFFVDRYNNVNCCQNLCKGCVLNLRLNSFSNFDSISFRLFFKFTSKNIKNAECIEYLNYANEHKTLKK